MIEVTIIKYEFYVLFIVGLSEVDRSMDILLVAQWCSHLGTLLEWQLGDGSVGRTYVSVKVEWKHHRYYSSCTEVVRYLHTYRPYWRTDVVGYSDWVDSWYVDY